MKTERDVLTALEAMYPKNEFALFSHVPSDAGFLDGKSVADAIAIGLWKSRGLAMHGFEVKVRRSDLLKELKSPAKADRVGAFCDFWWLVLGDEKLLKTTDRVPMSWGVIAPKGKRLRVVKKAVRNEERRALTRGFVVALIKHARRMLEQSDVAEREYARGWAEAKKNIEAFGGSAEEKILRNELGNVKDQLDGLKEAIAEFEKASGIRINEWCHARELGLAASMLLKPVTLQGLDSQLHGLLNSAKRIENEIQSNINQIEKARNITGWTRGK